MAKTFSKYSLAKRLPKAGGHLQAFLAKQSGLDRDVELRVLNRPVDETDPAYHRFVREFRALATLDHSTLIKVLDLGNVDGRLYYTTDLREARSLHEYFEEQELRPDASQILELLLPVGEALELMHKKSILHRDISLDSVRVDRKSERAYLATFALLKILRLPSLTDRGFRAPASGSAYTPEQAEGWDEGESTDVYLFATVLYQSLTGEHIPTALEVAQGKGGSAFELLPASEACAGLTPFLDDPLQRAMAYKPEDRPQSMKEFLEELAKIQKKLEARAVARSTAVGTQAMRAINVEEIEAERADPEVAKAAKEARIAQRREERRIREEELARKPSLVEQVKGVHERLGSRTLGGIGMALALMVAFVYAVQPSPESIYAATDDEEPPIRQIRRHPTSFKEIAKNVRELAKEVEAEATTKKSFEKRWRVLRRFVRGLPKKIRERDFPAATMANLQIAYFRNPTNACQSLDALLVKASEATVEL